MAKDCRTCVHNTYGGSPEITDWVSCMHPVTIARGPHWEKGDPAFVAMRTGDLPVSRIDEVANCPTWQAREKTPAPYGHAMLPNESHPGPGCSCGECLRNYPEPR